jgi:glycerol dehydrogenase-like iron-containing ADH family enzyme
MTGDPIVFQGIRSYVQGPGVVKKLGQYVARLGADRRTCVVIDQTILPLLEGISESLKDAGLHSRAFAFDGDLRADSVEEFAQRVRAEWDPGIVLGVGGGKAIDASKIVARPPHPRTRPLATLQCWSTSTIRSAPALWTAIPIS